MNQLFEQFELYKFEEINTEYLASLASAFTNRERIALTSILSILQTQRPLIREPIDRPGYSLLYTDPLTYSRHRGLTSLIPNASEMRLRTLATLYALAGVRAQAEPAAQSASAFNVAVQYVENGQYVRLRTWYGDGNMYVGNAVPAGIENAFNFTGM